MFDDFDWDGLTFILLFISIATIIFIIGVISNSYMPKNCIKIENKYYCEVIENEN